ncbi:MAG: FtsH protease activity modulator HflK [Alphaproteobacteria bacterium]
MSWNSQGGNNQGPWGGGNRGGRGGGNRNQPDLEDMIRQSQQKFKKILPGNFGSFSGITLLLVLVAFVWLGSGFYRPREGEQAVVLRFGEFMRTTGPGLQYHLPYPIETAIIQNVSRINRIDSGASSVIELNVGNLRGVEDQPLMLTGDENIADIQFTAFWFIKDLGDFLFKAKDPEATVKVAAESVVREIIAQTPIAEALTTGRGRINQSAQTLLQKLVDEYELGIQIQEVRLQKVDPPKEVIDAFRDVQRAKTDQERLVNEAESYYNDLVPVAEGKALKIFQQAEGYKKAVVAEAEGAAARFLSVYREYSKNPEVTKNRIKVETEREILRQSNKIVFNDDKSSVLPHMALPGILNTPQTTKKED